MVPHSRRADTLYYVRQFHNSLSLTSDGVVSHKKWVGVVLGIVVNDYVIVFGVYKGEHLRRNKPLRAMKTLQEITFW